VVDTQSSPREPDAPEISLQGPGPIDDLCTALAAAIASDDGALVGRLLADYSSSRDDWRAFTCYAADHYTRNLITRNGDFEVLLLCWGEGQESPIHDHDGEDCWMAVLDGNIEELRYASPDPSGAPPAVLPMQVTERATFEPGQVAFIRDDIGLHLVRSKGGPAASLHLYAKPFGTCRVFDAETGVATDRELVDDTVRGRKDGDVPLSGTPALPEH